MNEEDLEDEILGDDVRIKPDEHHLRDLFRQWIEPILAVLVAVLIGLVIWLLVVVLDVQGDQATDGTERARGSANTCRLLDGLGFPIDEDNRCFDPEVYQHWVDHQGETTRAANTAKETLDLLCDITLTQADVTPEQCVYRVEEQETSPE